MQPGRARTSGLGVPPVLLARWVGWVARVRPTRGVCFVVTCPFVALGVHVCAVSSAPWRLFTVVRAWCVLCAMSWATWLLSTGVCARRVLFRLRCPGPLGSFSPLCTLSVLCCVCGVLGDLAPVHRFARSACCVACAVYLATWLLFSGVHARRVVLRVQRREPLVSCPPVCRLSVLCCTCGALVHFAPVHGFARSACCVACAVSFATWLLSTGVHARHVVSCVRCPGTLGSCSPECALGVLCCVCGVLGHLAPVHLCARPACCVACVV